MDKPRLLRRAARFLRHVRRAAPEHMGWNVGKETATLAWSARSTEGRAVRQVIAACRCLAVLLIHVLAFLGTFLVATQVSTPARAAWHADAPRDLLTLVIAVKLLAVVGVGAHRGWWRYTTFGDLVVLVQAVTLGSLVIGVLSACAPAGAGVPSNVV